MLQFGIKFFILLPFLREFGNEFFILRSDSPIDGMGQREFSVETLDMGDGKLAF